MSLNPYQTPVDRAATFQQASAGESGDRLLRFSVDIQDFLEFQRFHFSQSRALQTQLYVGAIVAALFVTVFCLIYLAHRPLLYRLVFAGMGSSLCFVGVLAFFKWSIAYHSRRLLGEGSTEGLLGEHELRIDKKWLTEATAVNETRQLLTSISRIEETDRYAYIYVSSLQAHVIPKQKVREGDVNQFLKLLRVLQST